MDLPASVTALGEQLCGSGEIVPDPDLLHGADVFAAERTQIFARPWMAVDHATRLVEDGRYFRFEAATRSVLITRQSGGLHALHNVCIHAGYPVCEAEEGSAERLVCPYHGWEFALDGRLLEPELSSRIDPARLRMRSYPVCVRGGVIFVDLSGQQAAPEHGPLPSWLGNAKVTRRARYATNWNWKVVLQFLQSSREVLFADEADDDDWLVFGPLSMMRARPDQAALLRLIPRSAEQTDFQLIEMAPGDAFAPAGCANDAVADALRRAGDGGKPPSPLDRQFLAWYWSLMSAG